MCVGLTQEAVQPHSRRLGPNVGLPRMCGSLRSVLLPTDTRAQATSQDSSKYSQRHQPGASDHNSTRYAAGSPTNTVNSTLSLTKATPYSTRATEKIPAPLWPLRWCRPSSPAVKNQPSSLTVQPRPLHLSLRCFWPRPLMMKHRARRRETRVRGMQCHLCAQRLCAPAP